MAEQLTRAVLEQLVGKEVTVAFAGQILPPAMVYPSSEDRRAGRGIQVERRIEPFKYTGILKSGESQRFRHTVYSVLGTTPLNQFFAIPVVPVEEGNGYNLCKIIEGEGEQRREYEYSMERR